MLKELKKNKMSVVATGILFGVMGVLIIPMIAVIVKISNALSQKHPRIYKYSMIAFIGMLLAISLFCVVIKHQMSFLVSSQEKSMSSVQRRWWNRLMNCIRKSSSLNRNCRQKIILLVSLRHS